MRKPFRRPTIPRVLGVWEPAFGCLVAACRWMSEDDQSYRIPQVELLAVPIQPQLHLQARFEFRIWHQHDSRYVPSNEDRPAGVNNTNNDISFRKLKLRLHRFY